MRASKEGLAKRQDEDASTNIYTIKVGGGGKP
jgi:hypothetical protein